MFFIATFLIILVLILAMAIIVILQSFKSKYTKDLDEEGSRPCEENIEQDEFRVIWSKFEATKIPVTEHFMLSEEQIKTKGLFEHEQRCFCEDQSYFDIVNGGELKTWCLDIALSEVIKMSVSAGTSFVISMINFILVIIIGRIVLLIHFKSLSSQIATQLLFITIAVFINSLVSQCYYDSYYYDYYYYYYYYYYCYCCYHGRRKAV